MKLIKTRVLMVICLLAPALLLAQKVDYKAGVIQVDGKEVAKVEKIKDKGSFGLTSTFELHAMNGDNLIIATIATDFPESKNDNSSYYYRFTFLKVNQVAIFSLSKFGPEKSFAKLIGESGIVVDDKLDADKVAEFVARKSKNPVVAIEYHLVQRNRMFPVVVRPDNLVMQGDATIGKFKDVTRGPNEDAYEFSLPDGLVVAKVVFAGGNNATKFLITTNKDRITQNYTIPTEGTYGTISSAIDRNEFTLKRVAAWLVKQGYL